MIERPPSGPTPDEWVAARYGKRTASFVPSGTAALETALLACGVRRGQEVVVPEECCPAVPASVLRVGAVPVFASVGASLVLDAASVTEAASPRTAAVIAVHQYGLPAPLERIRAAAGDGVWVLEDCAQLWHADLASAYGVGRHSDVVVTSFGPRKPLTLGWGGAACADTSEVRAVLGLGESTGQLRSRGTPVAPFAVPASAVAQLPAAAPQADRALARRREFVAAAKPLLEAAGMSVLGPADPESASWHRLPVLLPEGAASGRERSVVAAKRFGLPAQAPHPTMLADLPLFHDAFRRNSTVFTRVRDRLILLRPPTRDAGAVAELRRWLDHMGRVDGI